jgi:hypothetical protein
LEDLGYNISDPRQAGCVLMNPGVKAARLAVVYGHQETNSAAKRENDLAMENLNQQIATIRNNLLKI